MTKKQPQNVPAPQVTTPTSTSVPIVAMALGVASLATFMWFLGIPAIIVAIIALRKYPANRGYSITGLVTGIISTLLMIGFILFISALVIVSVLSEASSDPQPRYNDRYEQRESDRYDDNRLYHYQGQGI